MISWSNLYLLRYEILINHHKIIWKINKYDSEEEKEEEEGDKEEKEKEKDKEKERKCWRVESKNPTLKGGEIIFLLTGTVCI